MRARRSMRWSNPAERGRRMCSARRWRLLVQPIRSTAQRARRSLHRVNKGRGSTGPFLNRFMPSTKSLWPLSVAFGDRDDYRGAIEETVRRRAPLQSKAQGAWPPRGTKIAFARWRCALRRFLPATRSRGSRRSRRPIVNYIFSTFQRRNAEWRRSPVLLQFFRRIGGGSRHSDAPGESAQARRCDAKRALTCSPRPILWTPRSAVVPSSLAARQPIGTSNSMRSLEKSMTARSGRRCWRSASVTAFCRNKPMAVDRPKESLGSS